MILAIIITCAISAAWLLYTVAGAYDFAGATTWPYPQGAAGGIITGLAGGAFGASAGSLITTALT